MPRRNHSFESDLLLIALFAAGFLCFAQEPGQPVSPLLSGTRAAGEMLNPQKSVEGGAPEAITSSDAIARAQKIYSQYLSAATDAQVAREDALQAKNGMLPSFSYRQDYLGTQGNGKTPNGRYVTNDGVHVYRVWGVMHQDMPAGFFTGASYKRAKAAAALAGVKQEIARRGLVVTVTRNFYTLIAAQRKYASARQSADQAAEFLDNAKKLEQGGESAHADVVKAQLQFDQQKVALREAELAMNNAHLALAVMLSPTFDENFTAVDDMDHLPALPPMLELRAQAARENQDIRAAVETLAQANADVSIARAGFFPTFSLDAVYGIEANALALHSAAAAAKQLGPLPNLGYFITASATVPVWNWGITRSRLKQAELRRAQATADLTQTQREALSNFYSSYNEADAARSEVKMLRDAADQATESLRLTNLRYQAGEATALEIVDAQNALLAARNAFDDGQARYWVALAALQTLTGRF
ncbi:MAG: TolC family protein [Acidobacteriaceae bacterium]|nr:TolC family protein [Acidobacteriaceae bacterium]